MLSGESRSLELESGRTVYEHNEDKLFVLASNAKLFSTALGLVKLGPRHILHY